MEGKIINYVTNGIDGFTRWNAASTQLISYHEVPYDSVVGITKHTIKKFNAADLENEARRFELPKFKNERLSGDSERTLAGLSRIEELYSPDDLILPGKDLKIRALEAHEEVLLFLSLREHLSEVASRNSALHCVHLDLHLKYVLERLNLVHSIQVLESKLAPDSLALSKEYHDRLKMLKKLDYVDEHDLVTFKGRVACEIHHQELLVTELVLDGKLHKRKPAEVAALLSATTCQYKSQSEIRFPANSIFQELYEDVSSTEDRIRAIAISNRIQLSEVGDEIRFDLMEVVYAWAQGEVLS